MRPIIGLIPLYDEKKDSYWMLPGYMKVLEKCGALPIMLPLTSDKSELSQAFKICDGLLFTGGHDVGPAVYGQEKSEKCGDTCELRDNMEAYLLDRALEMNMPVFGICRGIQFFNAHLGGSLYQDLPSEYECKVEHHMSPPYDRQAHGVEVKSDTLLASIIGAGVHEVNSYHHQAIKKLAEGVIASAVSEDGLIEGIEVKNRKFAMAVQWHPEFSYESNEDSVRLIQAFVDACK